MFNGFAALSDLEEDGCQKWLIRVQEVEKLLGRNSSRYWDRQWEYPFCLLAAESFRAAQEGRDTSLRALDAGAGLSPLPFCLARQGVPVTALDIDDGRFAAPGSVGDFYREHKEVARVEFVAGDVQEMPFGEGEFDLVFCVSTLEHVPEPERALRELQRVVRPEGLLCLTVDVSLDDSRSLLPEQYARLVGVLGGWGEPWWGSRGLEVYGMLRASYYWRREEWDRLPWRPPRYSALAVAGLAYRRRG